MWQIRKHVLPPPKSNGQCVLTVNEDCRILSGGMQAGEIVLWTLESTERDEYPTVLILFVLNTGSCINAIRDLKHVSTLTSENGIVWHIFRQADYAAD